MVNTDETDNSDPGPWKKLEILSRPLSSLITALIVAGIGIWGNHVITRMTQIQQDTHLYTQLMANREESESNLRKDMFTTILTDLISEPKKQTEEQIPAHEQIDNQLLKLELLAQNFSESLSLHPLFNELVRDINTPRKYAAAQTSFSGGTLQKQHEQRIRSLAKLVTSRQIAAIKAYVSTSRSIDIPISQMIEQGNRYEWPRDGMFVPSDEPAEDFKRKVDYQKCLVLGNSVTHIGLLFQGVNKTDRTIDVIMDIQTKRVRKGLDLREDELCGLEKPPSREWFVGDTGQSREPVHFTLDHYNFPLIDNTLIAGDTRLAVVLKDFLPPGSEESKDGLVKVYLTLFPARYTARRDTPSLLQAVEQLREDTGGSLIDGVRR